MNERFILDSDDIVIKGKKPKNYSPSQPRDKDGRWTTGLGFGSNPGGGRDYKPGTVRYSTAEPHYFENTFNSAALTNARLDAKDPVVKRLRKAIRNGEQIDSIVTYPDKSGKKNVADGHHRLSAFMQENKRPQMLLNFPDRESAWEYVNAHPTGYLRPRNSIDELLFIWNGWDESKHPRDKKGRFTFVINISKYQDKDGKFTAEGFEQLRQFLKDRATKTPEAAKQYEIEKQDSEWWQNSGFRWINDATRSGTSLEDACGTNVDASCRFSSDKPIKLYRGESDWRDFHGQLKVGDKIPDGMYNSIIATSPSRATGDKFASQDRTFNPEGTGKLYETVFTFNVPPTQRFGIPSAYNKTVADIESEIILPYRTEGKITNIVSKEVKVGNRTVVQREIEITL